MFKNIIIIVIFSFSVFLGTYQLLIRLGFGPDPRQDFCPTRWETRTDVAGNNKQRLYYKSGHIEESDAGAVLVAQYICTLEAIDVDI